MLHMIGVLLNMNIFVINMILKYFFIFFISSVGCNIEFGINLAFYMHSFLLAMFVARLLSSRIKHTLNYTLINKKKFLEPFGTNLG